MTAKLLVTTLACGAGLWLSQPAQAQTPQPTATPPSCGCPPPPPEGHHPGGPRERHGFGDPLKHLTKELGLTEEQQAKIKPILEEGMPVIRTIEEDAHRKVEAMMNGIAAQVRPLLTSDQQKKLDALKERMQKGPRPPFAGGPGGMPGHQGPMAGGERPPMPPGGHPDILGRLTQELNLNADQQAKLKAIAETVKPQMKALHEDTSISPEDRHAKVKALFENAESQFRPSLTSEQAQKLDEIKAHWKEHGPRPPQMPPQPPQ